VNVTFVGFPRIDPAVALVTAVPGIDREFPDESVHAFVVSSKFAASNHMYGVSVTRGGLEAMYEVPAPSDLVFHPAKVNPVLTKGSLGLTDDPSFGAKNVEAAEDTAVVEFGAEPPVFEFPL
jgi:hypothetical protein